MTNYQAKVQMTSLIPLIVHERCIISHALSHNWSATVVALALRNAATLRALIDEANA